MARCAKSAKNRRSRRRDGGYSKVRARTERMNAGVRLALCGFVLTCCVAFLVSALKPHRELEKMRVDLSEVQSQEMAVIERKDSKEREYRAIDQDTEYKGIIARDRLNYYIPGEHIFRIER